MGRPGIAASALKQPTRTAVALPAQHITIEPTSLMLNPPEVEQRALYPFHDNRIQPESALGLYALTNSATVIAM